MANARFSKINIGKQNKRGKFDLSHGVTTTFDFGSTQPLFCKLMMPDSSLKGDMAGAVRCMPMPLPPFGKCGLHTYAQFVKIGDLLRNFGSFVSRTVYTSAHASYIPNKLPCLPIYGPTSLVSLLLTPRFSFWCPFKLETAASFGQDGNGVDVGGISMMFTGDVDATDMSQLEAFVVPPASLSSTNINNYFGFVHANNLAKPWYNGFTDANRVYANISLGNDFKYIVNAGFSLQNADYFFTANANSIEIGTQGNTYDNPLGIAVWLTAEGRRLVKILNGLGIQVNLTDSSLVNLLPLFAYYKVWFDIFAPKRDMLWTGTQAYRLLDWYCEYGEDFADIGNLTDIAEQGVTVSNLCEFLYDLTQTWGTSDPNYITSSVSNANESGVTLEFDSPELDANVASSKSMINGGVASQSKAGTALSSIGIELINKLARYVNTNNVIGKNIDAFFKAHFDGYSGNSDTSDFCGASVLDIELGDVIVTADTDVADAGEFAGVGFGRGDFKVKYSTKEFGYYIILGTVLPKSNYVQGSDYDVFITKPLELPTPELDALGWDKLRISEVFGNGYRDTVGSPLFGNNAFGYQPRYTGHKVQNSKLMGDFKFNGTKDNYIGMTLDNVITQDYIVPSLGVTKASGGTVTTKPNTIKIYSASNSRFATSPNWRYLGKDKVISNFDRIFKNSSIVSQMGRVPLAFETSSSNEWERVGDIPQFDNFVSHFELSLTYNAPLSNISASYFTLEGSDNFVNHE